MSDECEPASPCISVCLLDDQGICVGCYRSAQEITDWFMADAMEKWEIFARCNARRDAAQKVKLR